MKASELMVGDLVQNPLGLKGRVRSIKYIPKENADNYGGYFLLELVFSESAQTFPINDARPIPITPEILEKNGFKKLGFDGWEFDYETEGGCLIYEVLWRCDYPKEYHTHLTIKSYYPDFGSFKSFRIDSVHELQHALRLCGIKKEIKI